MKKILSVLLVCLMVFGTGTVVFASGQPSSAGNAGNKAGSQLLNGQNSEANKEFKAQMDQARTQIRLYHDEAAQLREEIRDCAQELRLQIKSSIENEVQLTPEEVATLKEAIQQIRKDREEMRLGHHGIIAEQVGLMKQARLSGGRDVALAAMDKIQAEQQLRIEDLTRILDQMEDLLDSMTD